MVRLAEDADLPAIARLRRELTVEQEGDRGDPDFEAGFAAWWARESTRRIIWLADVEHDPVGMMNLAVFERMPRPGRVPSRWGYLGNAFVLAPYRNQGIGGQLLAAALGYAREPLREVHPVLPARRVRARGCPDGLDPSWPRMSQPR